MSNEMRGMVVLVTDSTPRHTPYVTLSRASYYVPQADYTISIDLALSVKYHVG